MALAGNLKVYAMWWLGLVLCSGLYFLLGLHFFTYLTVISPLIKKRFGTELGLTWEIVGFVLLYNVIYNHFFAMVIKPGSPSDLKMIEEMRSA